MTAEISPSPLRAVGRPVVDVDAAAAAVEDLMRALGMDVEDPGLRRKPSRGANAHAEMSAPREFGLTPFPNEEGYDELVVARDIPFTSICEHHLLPFFGTASVGYLPGHRILGLSKLAWVRVLFPRRPQVQERLTKQVANWLDDHLNPRGVGGVMQAEHSCMTLRGV